MDDESKAYAPTEDDIAMFRAIRDFVQQRPDRFKVAGDWLDERFGWPGFERHRIIEKRRQHREHRLDPHEVFPVTRAGRRKWSFPDDTADIAPPRRLVNRGPRVRSSKGQRFMAAVGELVGLRPLHEQRKADAGKLADRILLVSWLATDPEAHERQPAVTEFQQWGWTVRDIDDPRRTPSWVPGDPPADRSDDPASDYANRVRLGRVTPEEAARVDALDAMRDRYWMRHEVFLWHPQWIGRVREAWAWVQREGGEAEARQSQAASAFTPTEADADIMQALAEASTTLNQSDIEAGSGRPRSVVKHRLSVLEDAGLVHRPHGVRKGYALTDEAQQRGSTG